ncbi:MAG TPA: hypothetical protein VKA09_13635, partial [Nitrososphaeraceae archaeon]|nr:hypothetical protein [Nitrososphaeraceae archaeon]
KQYQNRIYWPSNNLLMIQKTFSILLGEREQKLIWKKSEILTPQKDARLNTANSRPSTLSKYDVDSTSFR